jgi:uncharacterized membrane protein
MSTLFSLARIGLLLLYIILPLLGLYILYLILTKAFKDMGFSSFEAIIIVFISFLFGFNIVIAGINVSNIYLFSFHNWIVRMNVGGAVIPILLSVYLTLKKKISLKKIFYGMVVVAVITFFVTYPDPEQGIVSRFPYWVLPALAASIVSVFLSWKNYVKAAPLAYISGTIGVLIGADVFHLGQLLLYNVESTTNAVIGGANVFDMVFITGILAVVVDGVLMYRQRAKQLSS